MPAVSYPASVRSGTGSVVARFTRISSGQSIATPPARTPLPASARTPSTASAALTRIFFGTHPRSAHVPPNGRESTTATFQPASRQRDAAFEATPVPTTTRS